MSHRRRRARGRGRGRQARRDRARHHPRRIHPRRSPRAGAGAAHPAAAPYRQGAPGRHQRRSRGREVDADQRARHPADRSRASRRGARRRPVLSRTGGSILGDKTRMPELAERRQRVHPALPHLGPARRRRPGDPGVDPRHGGGRLRRRHRRDGGGRPVRDARRGDDRHLRAAGPGAHRRPAAGHQERRARARRRRRGQQGRRAARARVQARRA